MKSNLALVAPCAILSMISVARTASASLIAYDTAGDSAYNSGVVAGANGGYGWGGPWSYQAFGLFTTGSSSVNGSGGVNSPSTPLGRAWRLTPPTQFVLPNDSKRPFGGAMLPGQTFAVDFDAGIIDSRTQGESDAVIGGNGGSISVTAYPRESPDYLVGGFNAGAFTVGSDSGIPLTNEGIHIEFTIVNDSEAVVSITSLAPGGARASIITPFSTPATFAELFNSSNGFYASDLYFNNMAITPEPLTGLGIVILAGSVLAIRRPARRTSRASARG